MATETLTSLAMLKVSIDRGADYLDYLRPFILQVLIDERPDPVTDSTVHDFVRSNFGLEVPERAVQIVLKRLSKSVPLNKDTGVYKISGTLPGSELPFQKAEATKHIRAVVSGLIEFSKGTAKPIATDDDAVRALCAFLSEFNIPFLRAYLRGSAIPPVSGNHPFEINLVSQYAIQLQHMDPGRFESFMVLVQGHMLANALLCPDLQNAPRSYKGMEFYLDTPLLVQYLGLEGKAKGVAVTGLIELLHDLGGTVLIFSHSHEELGHVIRGASDYIDSPKGRGAIVMEARRKGTTKSDLLLLAGDIDAQLKPAKIEVEPTPKYIREFQIDENAFEKALEDEVSYFNPRAKDYDVNSVRSIYALRAGSTPTILEKSKAVLVTSNSGFAKAAYQYGQRFQESREVSPVITDFSLANMAWLKAPMGAPSLPMEEILAFSYAALRPSMELLNKYFLEIEKLQKRGKISERDHQLLRSSVLAQDELMRMTLGDEEALTAESVSEILERVSIEIKKEESDKLNAELAAHRETQQALAVERGRTRHAQQRLYWRCFKKAKRYSWIIATMISVLLIAGLAAGFGLKSSNPVVGWILVLGTGLSIFVGIYRILIGFTVKQMRRNLERRLLKWLIRREAVANAIDMSSYEE